MGPVITPQTEEVGLQYMGMSKNFFYFLQLQTFEN